MKNINLFILFMCFALLSNAQKVRERETVSDYKPIPKSELLSLDKVKELRNQTMKQANAHNLKRVSMELPRRIDNSKLPYMRPVFDQKGGSCGSASRISYMFAYEINCYRGLPGNLKRNMYPSHFTWLLTGQHSGKETMARDNGIPNAVTYGGDLVSAIYGGDVHWPDAKQAPDYGWMQGYDKWYQAMNNRIEKNIAFSLNSEESLNLLKEWFLNHWGDTDFPAGGVAGAGCATNGMQITDATNGEKIVLKWGNTIDHGTTWVGYDDDIAYDFNKDGKITNDIDVNGDGVVNMQDWEKGALIMRNSWSDNWGNKGNIYVPYRFMNQHAAELYFVRKDYTPRRTMKITMNYSARSEIKISIGIAKNLNATQPERTIECEHFRYAGNGKVPMLGKWADGKMHTEDMEFGYDITDLTANYDATTPLKYFLKIEREPVGKGTGKVTKMSVINYDNEFEPVETVSEQTDVEINKRGATYVSVVVAGGQVIPTKYLSNEKWKVIGFDSENTSDNSFARNAIDGNPETIWHTKWAGGADNYPHHIIVDMGEAVEVSKFEYLPRQGSPANGTIADYEFYLTNDKNNWGEPIATGKWAANQDAKVISFEKQTARYFKLVAKSEINKNPWASAAELRFIKHLAPKYIKSNDWEVIDFNSQSEVDGDLAKNAIDGNPLTKWHTKWSNGVDNYPHHITVDMKREHTLSIFEYLPRQDQEKANENNGTVAQYELYLSNDPANWGEPVARGTWEDNYNTKYAIFKETKARYFKFVALSEVKGRKFASAAELRFRNMNPNYLPSGLFSQPKETSRIQIWYSNKSIQMEPIKENGNIKIVNLQGQTIYSKDIALGTNSVPVNLSSGVYIVWLSFDNGHSVTQKIVIQK